MNLLLDIAATHLRQRRRQTVVSVIGVAVGVGFSVAMAALLDGANRDFIVKIVDATPHVMMKDEFRVAPRQPIEARYENGALELRGIKPKPEPRGIRNAKAKLAILSRLAGVAVAPNLRGQVILSYGSKDVAASIVGVDPARERLVNKLPEQMLVGDLEALERSTNGLIIGRGLARNLGVELNNKLSVISPAGVVLNMKVVGIFHSGIAALDQGEVYALLKKVQILENRPDVINRIRLRLENAYDARRLATILENRFHYRTESWQEANEGVLEIIAIRNMILYTTVSAILLVASFGIFNLVSTITHEKSQDIAILKSLGFLEQDIRSLFLVEGLTLGLLGAGLGCVLGYTLSRLLGAVRFQVEMVVEMQNFPIHYSALHYALASSVALVAATLAAYLPARRAARLNPVDIIRGAA